MKIPRKLKKLIKSQGYNPEDYTEDQRYQLQLGLEKGLDITSYISPENDHYQMKYIREGLESRYTNGTYARFWWD